MCWYITYRKEMGKVFTVSSYNRKQVLGIVDAALLFFTENFLVLSLSDHSPMEVRDCCEQW